MVPMARLKLTLRLLGMLTTVSGPTAVSSAKALVLLFMPTLFGDAFLGATWRGLGRFLILPILAGFGFLDRRVLWIYSMSTILPNGDKLGCGWRI